MTNFNREGSFKDIEQWEDLAESKAANTGISVKVIGGILVAGTGVVLGAELLGGVLAAWAFKSAYDSVKTMGKRLRLVRECGCNAFVLDPDEFKIYLAQFGEQTVFEELRFVQETGIRLPGFTASWLKTSKLNELSQASKAKALKARQETLPEHNTDNDEVQDSTSASSEAPSFSSPSPGAIPPFVFPGNTPTTQQHPEEQPPDQETSDTPKPTQPLSLDLLQLPIRERANRVVAQLLRDGFQVDAILSSQVVAIASPQRGGKGTLAGLLAVLSQALEPKIKVIYISAGIDIYPYRCELHSAYGYPDLDVESADTKVSQYLLAYLKRIANDPPYSHKNEMLVIDEAMKLFGLMSEEDRQWAIEFVLCRYAKLGGVLILVLHASNLSAVVGSRNTEGLADTFQQSISFIGCSSRSVRGAGLTSLNIASGEYFRTNPKNFGIPEKDGYLGCIPKWLTTFTHPGNGFPDPVRTLLKMFPELEVRDIKDIEVNLQDSPVSRTAPTVLIEDAHSHLNACFSLPSETEEEAIAEQGQGAYLLDCLIGIIHGANSYPISFEAIRTSRKWKHEVNISTPKRNDLRAALYTLVTEGILQGDEESGYILV